MRPLHHGAPAKLLHVVGKGVEVGPSQGSIAREVIFGGVGREQAQAADVHLEAPAMVGSCHGRRGVCVGGVQATRVAGSKVRSALRTPDWQSERSNDS